MDPVDRSIHEAVARADHDAAAALILRHFGPKLLGQARASVGPAAAEDVLLETVLSLLEAIAAGRVAGGSLLAYAMGMVRHKAAHLRDSFWHRLFHRRAVATANFEEFAGDAISPEEPAPEEGCDLRDVLAVLSERERVVLMLRLEKKSYACIGRALGISEAAAAQIHSRAVKRAREALTRPRAQR